MSAQTVHLPNIHTKYAYEGKFRDWTPSTQAAGKLTANSEDSVERCLKPKDQRPDSPEIVRKFRATFRPDMGKRTVFYGQAYDPHRKWAKEMRHGVLSHPSQNARELINPPPKTLYQQKVIDVSEKDYASHVRAPVGALHDQTPGLPKNLDLATFTFGLPTNRGPSLREIVNPNKTYAQVEAESAVAHDKYIITHKDYDVGENVDRGYTVAVYSAANRYGKPTPHDETGAKTGRTLRWMYDTLKEKADCVVSKRLQDFRDKTQPLVGHHHDPLKDTMNVGPDHVYGLLPKPDEFSVGDLIHNRVPGRFLRDRDQQRGLVAAMRQQLGNQHYHSFPDLIHAFRFYDKEGTGKIEMDDIREVCHTFNLPIDVWLLEQIFDYLNVDRDRLIDYMEFAKFLDWNERLPTDFATVPHYTDFDKTTDLTTGRKIGKSSDFLQQGPGRDNPQTDMSTSPRLQTQIDRAIADRHTTAEMICSGAGPTGQDTTKFPSYGVPTIRTDLAPPRIRRVSDRENYGDESDAHGLLHPSVYSAHGVHERDLLIPRTMQEVKEIFGSIGVHMSDETLETIYSQVAAEHAEGHVSVETFRCALDEIQAAQAAAGTPLRQSENAPLYEKNSE